VQHTTVVGSIAFTGYGFTVDLKTACAGFDHRSATGAVTDSGDSFAIEGVVGAACVYHAWAVNWAVMAVAYEYYGFHLWSPGLGAVRDSRSISTGHWTLGAR